MADCIACPMQALGNYLTVCGACAGPLFLFLHENDHSLTTQHLLSTILTSAGFPGCCSGQSQLGASWVTLSTPLGDGLVTHNMLPVILCYYCGLWENVNGIISIVVFYWLSYKYWPEHVKRVKMLDTILFSCKCFAHKRSLSFSVTMEWKLKISFCHELQTLQLPAMATFHQFTL